MKTTRQFLLISAASVLVGVCTHVRAQERLQNIVQRAPDSGTNPGAQTLKLSGTVTDAGGNLVAGATVAYWRFDGNLYPANPLALVRQTTTETNGAFELQISREQGFLLAQKPGLAPAWKLLNLPFNSVPDREEHLVLTPPAALAGVVVDEADKPVANAEVSVAIALCEASREDGGRTINFITGKPAHDNFAVRTDAAGQFRIGNFPTNATAALAVQAPGKVLRQSEPNVAGLDSLPWRAGQDDIKLAVEPAGSVEGRITVEGSNQSPPIARLILQPDRPGFAALGEREPALSGPDGAFHISDVAAGSYQIQAVFGTNAVREWVADMVPVSVESGQPARGVQIAASRGGLLEVAVLGKDDRKPLAQVMVNAYKQIQSPAGGRIVPTAASSDSNGIVRLRLQPGDYQVSAIRASMSVNQTSARVEAGRTNHVEIEIAAPKEITGIIRQPDGQPAAGLPVKIVGAFGGPSAADVKTDADGKFELEWNPRQFAGQNDATACILIRDTEHDLAVAGDIDEDAGLLDLKLAPGLTLAGRVESDGKPVTNVAAQLVFWSGNRGTWLQGLARTNIPGQYEIPALPPGRKYGVIVSAPGYGQKQNHTLEISADPGRQELDPMELKPANLKLAGQVLDADDKPVPGASVNLNGDGQPGGNARTDREGRFTFDHVCEGALHLFANSQGSFGNISAEGGDTNVVLRMDRTSSSSPGAQTHKLKGVVTDADGKPAAGAQVVVFPNNGTHWIKTGTNGQYNLTWSLQPWQAQNGGAYFVARDPASDLAAVEELPEETTNLNVKLKPALTLAGLVKNAADAPLPGAQVGLWFKAGNTYQQVDEQVQTANAGGRYEIKCLPADGQYMVYASAKGYGRSQRQIGNDSETNRLELEPFVLKPADQIIAGQVLNENDKPVSGAKVQLNGNDQPNGNTTTDSKGRFHFQVCEGQVRLFANSPQGGGFAQASAEAGDTNIVMTLNSNPGMPRQTASRAPLKGSPLPDLTTVNLAADAAPAAKPVLLCLFDADQRPSRHVISQLEQQAAAIRQQNVSVLGVQAAVTGDETFNEWKSASPVSFPLGRVTEKSAKSNWASAIPALPWLILTDASHRVIAEGFALDDLDAQIQKLK